MRNNEERLGTNEDQSTPTTLSPLDFVTPTSFVKLPSKGLFYPEDHPLHKQETIEVKEMTAKEEDILTSQALAQKGLTLDRLLASLVLDKAIKPNSLLIGDKNAIIVQTRINAYGSEYKTSVTCPSCGEFSKYQFDLYEIEDAEIELLEGVKRLPNNNIMITLSNNWDVECRMLTGKDETKLTQEVERKRKKKLPESPLTDMLNTIIVSVSGHADQETIKKAVAFMPAKDTRFLRDAYQAVIPNVDMSQLFICPSCEYEENMEVPLTAEFFWPKRRV
tara:strand:+ start:666 stop:1496 length:831 start_codon:yes stop_codon:yes gene_type:complete